MSNDASVRQNATAALLGVVVGYLVHGHWPAIEALIRAWVG